MKNKSSNEIEKGKKHNTEYYYQKKQLKELNIDPGICILF